MFASDHIGLLTGRSDRLVSFYKLLGFKLEKRDMLEKSIAMPVFGVKADCLFLRMVSGNVKIEIFHPVSSKPKKSTAAAGGLHHWGYSTGDREKFIKKLKKKKIRIITVKRGSHPVYFVKDPDGYLVLSPYPNVVERLRPASNGLKTPAAEPWYGRATRVLVGTLFAGALGALDAWRTLRATLSGPSSSSRP